MSAPPRGPGGGTMGGRSTPPSGPRGRGAGRSSTSGHTRGRGGRGRGALSATNPRAEGLLQGLQNGSLNKRGESGSARAGRGEKQQSLPRRRTALCPRPSLGNQTVLSQTKQPTSSACLPKKGRSSTPQGPSRSTQGRGATASRANNPLVQTSNSAARANPSQKDFMTEMSTKFQDLKQRREIERAKAIRDGFLADPEKKTSLDKAITPVGTCEDMCPEFERVERVVQNMVEKPEKMPNEATGRNMPAEGKMVKRFRRSAAGNDEQLPSDIRTPATLQTTLNYLITDVIGVGEQLSAVHKFVWDRTRAIRNDFSIQQVSKDEDVRLAIDCFEKIARFHILSLHQLSNPDNLAGEGFDAHQELEQLNNTLLSLMYYYDDNRAKQRSTNEAEFRAYYIMFELRTSHPDLEDRMQSWPPQLLNDRRVQTAFRLYSAAANTLVDQGPLKPTAPFSIAQGNSGVFWRLLKSKAVSYLMSCVAEIHFGQVRYLTLQNLWESHKGPVGQQIKNQEWTLEELTDALAFDDEDETYEFCQGYGLTFKTSDDGVYHLVFQSASLDQSSTPRKQVFSHSIVEAKRYRRSLVAVINGIGVARAIREGLVEADSQQEGEQPNAMPEDSGDGLFFPDNDAAPTSTEENDSSSNFNPKASFFTPGATNQPQPTWPSSTTSFGKPSAVTPFAPYISAPAASTDTATSGSSLLSSYSTKSASSTAGFGAGSTPSFVSPFTPKAQPPTTSLPSAAPASAPFKFPDFKFRQPITNAPLTTSASFPSSFGRPSAVPFTFGQPSTLQRDKEQEQPLSLEKPGDAPVFVPSLPGESMPWTPPAEDLEESSQAFPVSKPEGKPLGGSPWPGSERELQENREPPQDRLPIFQESLPPPSFPQPGPDDFKDDSAPLQPPPSPRSPNLEFSEDVARPPPSFYPPNTGMGFYSESSFTDSSSRNTDANTTRPPITAVVAPNPIPPSDSVSRPSSIPFDSLNTPQQPPSWKIPAPSVEAASGSRAPNLPETSPARPVQFPVPHVQPKNRKLRQPKTKELKAVSPNDPTPRDHSPLRERPVIFGDDANAFRQSAALTTNPPSRRLTLLAHDRDRAAETVARLGMLQRRGLLQAYVEFTLPDLLKPVMQQHEREKPILAAKAARCQMLAKKYFKQWRTNTYRRVKNRQARERRQRIDAFKQEGQRRMRADAELIAILQAQKEAERVQAEMRARSTIESKEDVQDGVPQTAGHKRKSIHVDRAEGSVNETAPRKIAKGHNRSRTIGHAEELFDSSRTVAGQSSANTNTAQPMQPIYSGRPISKGGGAPNDLRRSLSGRRDTTRTDYFRLKALGVDPDTPIVPDTKSSLERKRQREEDNDDAAARTRARTLSPSTKPPIPHFSPPGGSAIPTSGQHQSRMLSSTTTWEATSSTATKVDDDDELLREARKAREAFSSGAEWFKTQAANIEKEEREEYRRSASQPSSRSSPHPSASGLARTNGYEYLPGPEIPGRSLSRTEERIRRTGAHGLATKPIGGSGGYLAVAMSRDSAAKLNVEKQSQAARKVNHVTNKTGKSKRKVGEKDNRYIPQESDDDSEELEDDAEANEFSVENQSQRAPEVLYTHSVRRTRKGKRKTGEKDGRYIPQADEDSEELESDAEPNGLDYHSEPRTNGKRRAVEPSHHIPKQDGQLPEEYDGVEEQEYVQESLEQPHYTRYDGGETEDLYEGGDTEDLYEGGDTEDLYEDGDEEEDRYDEDEGDEGDGDEEGEDEEADEVGALPNEQGLKGQGQQAGGYWLRSSVTPERGLTPNGGGQIMSRASSGMGTGTGASVDDALVLDSD